MLHHNPVTEHIRINTPWWGLGAMVSATSSQLIKINTIPTIEWWNHFYTGEPRPSTNIFNWFYRQPQKPSQVIIYENWDERVLGINAYRDTNLVQLVREKWQLILNRRLSVADGPAATGSSIQKLPGVLGVHYRGTDKRAEVPMPPSGDIVDVIKKAQKAHNLPSVLICTDDQDFIDRCLLDIPAMLYFKNHLRISGTVGLHQAAGSYRQCKETMVEIKALGLCRHLILGRSCVADAALFLGSSPTWEYYN